MKLLFYKPKTIMGRLIKLFSPLVLGRQAKYSHVGIQLDEYHILDINGGGNSQIRHIQANESDFDIVAINLSIKQEKLLEDSLGRYLDLDYDYFKAITIYDNTTKYTCYELVNLILYDMGYFDKIYNIELPEDLIKLIEKEENKQ